MITLLYVHNWVKELLQAPSMGGSTLIILIYSNQKLVHYLSASDFTVRLHI